MPIDIHECNDCRCTSHQIIAAGGCPRRHEFIPAGRPLIPGQDATPHDGKDFAPFRWLAVSLALVFGGVCLGAGLALTFNGWPK